ncbi:slipin family protein [Eubacterium ruminantium]|uniref:slipin family protein n=1 Tax=Eubacterium ruminantium TaxID=42322 RepID=UPI0024783621|nr:slipin family protein [Eubacterium ruminantium]
MKYLIRDDEMGFLIKNGKFERLLTPGKYSFFTKRGYEVQVVNATGEVKSNIPYEILEKDETFKKSVVRYDIDKNQIGFVYVNGNLIGVTNKGTYVYWNLFEKIEMKVFTMDGYRIPDEITKDMIQFIPAKYYTKVIVYQGQIGHVYVNKVLSEKLESGLYYYWNVVREITADTVDMRWRELNVAGQEILTRDKVGIRLNMVVNFRITDAEKYLSDRTNMEEQLYSFVQMVSREMIGNYKLDEILERRDEIGELMNKRLIEAENDFCVELKNFGIKDIILPGEIREIMNTVLVAEKKAQANVIERREEVASTRSLMNTAKLMDENKTLFQLKKLEYLERICNRVGEISVSGKGDLIEQLSQLI